MNTKVKASLDFDKLNDTLELITQAAKKFQFKVAQGEMQALLTMYPGAKSALRVYNNTLTSISEGMTDGHLTRAGARSEVDMANTEFSAAIKKSIDTLSQPSKYDPEVLYKDLSHDTLKVFDTNMNAVQVQLNKRGVFTGYVPVLPITQPPLDAGKLRSNGIVAENFAGYTILKKQFVAGITYDELKKLMPIQPGPGVSEAKVKAAEEEALKHFREVIEAKYRHLKLVQMGGTTGWWNAYWFWYATASEFKVLKSCTINSTTVQSLKIQNWSFPFHRKG